MSSNANTTPPPLVAVDILFEALREAGLTHFNCPTTEAQVSVPTGNVRVFLIVDSPFDPALSIEDDHSAEAVLLKKMLQNGMGLPLSEAIRIPFHAAEDLSGLASKHQPELILFFNERGSSTTEYGTLAIHTHSVSKLLQNSDLKRETWEDLQIGMSHLGLPH